MKYSINSTGYIVAERDIYSLGGFIPKGTVGAKVANEGQISQDGECWVAGGDISERPDVRIKDNAYIGNWVPSSIAVHTDVITELSGNTVIPGRLVVRCPSTGLKNNFFVKDSFIGVSLDVLCGPAATTTAFPFELGDFKNNVPKGTLFASMGSEGVRACRSTATLRPGRNTYLYIPTGYHAKVFWAYYNTSNQLAYSGESMKVAAGLTKLDHSVYKLAMVVIVKESGTAMTPTDLLATGVKILGHISDSVNVDIRPESASGQYVMVNSSLIIGSRNFGLATSQMILLAGGLFNSTTYTQDDVAGNKIYGTFRNVQRLEYDRYLSDSYRTDVNRDRFISAYDCPLLRVDGDTYNDALAAKGDLVLRRCIVPKAKFQDDVVNGNTYEDIDFSYANDHLGAKAGNNNDMWSSHKQGEYAAIGAGTAIAGLISRPENLAAGSILGPGIDSIPLDGSIMEQGTYTVAIGAYYENGKGTSSVRVRTGKPVSTEGLTLPTAPAGFIVGAAHYLDKDFKFAYSAVNPTSINTGYPYVVFVFSRDNTAFAIDVKAMTAFGLIPRFNNYGKIPEITGSAYVGAGCTVRGDVQLHGDPYVNRVLDVNLWERGSTRNGVSPNYPTWDSIKIPTGAGNRLRFIDMVPVEPGAKITCNSGYWILCYFFDANGNYLSSPGWGRISNIAPANSAFVGITIKKADAASDTGGLITEEDIPLANVKYVRAFKKRRYITNELDRTSPEDILLSADYWEQGGLAIAAENAGKPYEELKIGSPYRVRLKRPFGLGAGYRVTFSSGYSFGSTYYDAVTKLLYGSAPANMDNALFTLVGNTTDSPTAPITPADVTAGRLTIEFTPSPRIVAPYGSSNLFISGPKIRMYNNAVLSRNLNPEGEIVLSGDAVMGYDFDSGSCMCSNGHSDAIIKLP